MKLTNVLRFTITMCFAFLLSMQAQKKNQQSTPTDVFFSNTWKSSTGSFAMRACACRSWQRQFDEIGLGRKYKVVIITMTNKLGRDISLNPATQKFTILTNEGRQYYNSDFDSDDDYSAIKHLREEDRQSIFIKVMNIYDGASTPVIVLFPASIPSADTWSRIIFDNIAMFGDLEKGSLRREK